MFPDTCKDDAFGSTTMSSTDKKLAQKCFTTDGKEEEEELLYEVSLANVCVLIFEATYRT